MRIPDRLRKPPLNFIGKGKGAVPGEPLPPTVHLTAGANGVVTMRTENVNSLQALEILQIASMEMLKQHISQLKMQNDIVKQKIEQLQGEQPAPALTATMTSVQPAIPN